MLRHGPQGRQPGIARVAVLLFQLRDPRVGGGHDLAGLLGRSDAHGNRRPLAQVAEIADFVSLGVDPVEIARAAGSVFLPEHAVEGRFDRRGQFAILAGLLVAPGRVFHLGEVAGRLVEEGVVVAVDAAGGDGVVVPVRRRRRRA